MPHRLCHIPFDACPIPAVLVDAGGTIFRTNPLLDELLGYEAGELHGQPVEKLVPADVRAHHPRLRQGYAAAPVRRPMGAGRDLHAVAKNGSLIPVEIGLHPGPEGQSGVLVSLLDIRHRKASEDRLRLALEATGAAMIRTGKGGVIDWVNDRALDLFGYTREEFVGSPVEMLVPAHARERHAADRSEYAQRPRTRSMGAGRDLRAVRKDGSEFPVEIGLVPMGSAGQRGVMATIVDITDRKGREWDRVQAKNRELQRTNAELMSFAFGASHQLKAPLATTAGLLDLCLDEAGSTAPPALVEALEQALRLVKKAGRQLEELAPLSVPSPDDAVAVDVDTLVRDVWRMLPHHGVELVPDLQHSSRAFHTVVERFQLIVEHLFADAVQATRALDVQRVWLSTRSVGEAVVLTIRDSAQLDEQARRALTQRLGTQTDASSLSLAMVRQYVLSLGGHVGLFPTSEGTTEIRVVLPDLRRSSDS